VSNALLYAGIGYAAGSVLSVYLGDRFGTRRAYVGMLIASLAFVFRAFAIGGGHTVLLWVLLFGLLGTASGILPKYVSGHFPVRIRAAGLGFTYNVGAQLAKPLSLGTAIVVLGVAMTAVVVLLVGFNVPERLQRWLEPSPDLEKVS
jgi:SHS family sialic acid transporter-like MFS transporter